MLPLNLFELIILTILSKLRFSFYPFITFPDPLEYYTYKSALKRREERLDRWEADLSSYKRALDAKQKALELHEEGIKRRDQFLTVNQQREISKFKRDLELLDAEDRYGIIYTERR